MATAVIKYYSSDIELKYAFGMKNKEFNEKYPGIKGIWYDSFSRYVGDTVSGQILPVTRIIDYKKNPSLHKCDARCQHAKGRVCECSCGGKNHGIGG